MKEESIGRTGYMDELDFVEVANFTHDLADEVGRIHSPKDKLQQYRRIEDLRTLGEVAGNHYAVVDLSYNECLVGKHILKGAGQLVEKNPALAVFLPAAEAFGKLLMSRGVKKAREYLDTHPEYPGRDFLDARWGRFAGDLQLELGNTEKAIELFGGSIDRFNAMENWLDKRNALEISNFMAEGLVLTERTGEGIKKGIETYDVFDTQEWREFKEKDYSTWLVWRTGGVIKVIRAIMSTGKVGKVSEDHKVKLVEMYMESKRDIDEVLARTLEKEKGKYIPRRDELLVLGSVMESSGWSIGEGYSASSGE